MIAAIIIGSVVAYLVGAGVMFGFMERHGVKVVLPRILNLPARAGRRLATPKPQLPEARVIRGDDTGRGT